MVQLGLVIAAFDDEITSPMHEEAKQAVEDNNATLISTTTVPGAYDTPLAADRLARRDEIDAVAVVGAIITGDTDHDSVIGDAAAQGLTQVSLKRDTPVTLGIAGPGMTPAEARDRADYGRRAIESAIALAE